jgi:cytochrome d ubiquinol oxidase subunit I
MESDISYDRLQFAITVIFHYLFPQLTMGLALLILYFKTRAVWFKDEHYNVAAHFWIKIFGFSFAFGVVTGIPMEFQFGTNWAKFSNFAGGVIGTLLAMEGVFAFFLESFFLGILLFGERLGPRVHWLAALMLFLGSWLSGYFILATNAWMQHPVAYAFDGNGGVRLESFSELLTNPWLVWQYPHTMVAAVTTGSFVMAAVGAFYQLSGIHLSYARTFLKTGVVAGAVASLLSLYPTGHGSSLQVFEHQPITGAAFEGLFKTEQGAGLVIFGQPDMETLKLDNPLILPGMLSFLVYMHFGAELRGLEAFPREEWPDNIPLLYYSYHVMVGLGSIFLAIMMPAVFMLWREKLLQARWLLWIILLSAPFPYIANTAGWMTAELGRQHWLVYGVFRIVDGASPLVSSGNTLFTLIGFLGIYFFLGLLFLFLFFGVVNRGPGQEYDHLSVRKARLPISRRGAE